jgi:predicted lipoprotein with Yx(FWY)xxD motif
MRKRTWLVLTAAAVVLALAAAGCGGGYGSGGSSSTSSASAGSSSKATVSAQKTSLGTILVGANGKTLYLFEKDTGPKSTCFGGCAQGWPPLAASGSVTAGNGVDASKLGTVSRGGGTKQVTYAGHPLYFFVNDKAAGDTNGQAVNAFGAEWYVLSPSGTKIEKKSGSGGYGY